MNALSALALWFDPLRQIIFGRNIAWSLRWRLLILQQINLLVLPLRTLPYAFSRTYRIIWIPTRGPHQLRALVFEAPDARQNHKLRPLHIDFHAGAFVGGLPDMDIAFCEQVCRRTGASVVSVDYRLAPEHIYPDAHEDCEDAVSWILANAKEKFRADPSCLTVSGFSAGGNLMMVAGARARAAVGFYATVDLRVPPWEKPKSGNFPKKDPLEVLLPLYDSYAGPGRVEHMSDARLNPILKRQDELPASILFIVPGIDIAVHEQLTFIERVRNDIVEVEQEDTRDVQVDVLDDAFHGWFELPYLPEKLHADKLKAQDLAIGFITKAHARLQTLE